MPGVPSLHLQRWERSRGVAGHHLVDLAVRVEFLALPCPPFPCIAAKQSRSMSVQRHFANGELQGEVLVQASLNLGPWRCMVTGPAVGPKYTLQDQRRAAMRFIQVLRFRRRHLIRRYMRSSISAGPCSFRLARAAAVSRRPGAPARRTFAPARCNGDPAVRRCAPGSCRVGCVRIDPAQAVCRQLRAWRENGAKSRICCRNGRIRCRMNCRPGKRPRQGSRRKNQPWRMGDFGLTCSTRQMTMP